MPAASSSAPNIRIPPGPISARLAEQLETTEKANDVQRRMLEAATRRPRDREERAERLRGGRPNSSIATVLPTARLQMEELDSTAPCRKEAV
jgi:hypothetical protein